MSELTGLGEGDRSGSDEFTADESAASSAHPFLTLVPTYAPSDEVEAGVPMTEADLLRVERTSDAAMLAASETIAETVDELSRNAEAARLVRIEAEAQDAAALAACVAETAAAFEVGNEAAALRAAWLASKSAAAAAEAVVLGSEGRAAAAASRMAGRVAERVEERAAFDRRRARRAAAAATADVAHVAATVDHAAAAIE